MTTAAISATREVSWRPSFYRGEQYDPDLGLYYLRARYYNPNTGRFMSRDQSADRLVAPKTLHKYLYASGDPVNLKDPTGRDAILEFQLIVYFTAYRVAPVAVATGIDVCALFKFYDNVQTAINLERGLIDHEWDSGPSNWDIFYEQAKEWCDSFAG